jgi:hypothetical protein
MFPMHFPTCSDNLPIMFPKFPMCSPIWTTLITVAQMWTCITHKGGGRRKGSQHLFYFFFGGVCNVFQNFVVMGQSKWLLAKRQKNKIFEGPLPN